MSDNIKVTISAEDRASREFAKVADGAERMGRDIEDASKRSGRSLQDLENDIRNVGAGVGIMAAAMALSGQSFRDQEIALNTLRRTYGDAATGLEEFSQALSENSNYSEEAIISAANVAATLSRNYGATAAEIQQILQISADLAATSGYAFEDAAQRVVAALRGEAEAAEMLGLTMNQQSIDRENLTLSMSNQEAFQFRLNALTEQSAFAMGAAAEQADTMYGSMTDLEGTIRDAAQSVGDFLGPVGEIGAYAADNAIQVAAFTLGVGQMTRGLLAARSLVQSFNLSLGPAGLALAAGTIAVAGLALLSSETETWQDEAQAGTDAADNFTDSVVRLGEQAALTGTTLELATKIAEVSEALEGNADVVERNTGLLEDLEAQQALLNEQAEGARENWSASVADLEALTDAERAHLETLVGSEITYDELTATIAALSAERENAGQQSAAFAEAEQGIIEILNAQGAAFADNKANLSEMIQRFLDGRITADQFVLAVRLSVDALHDEQLALALGTDATEQWTASTEKGAVAALELADALGLSLTMAGRSGGLEGWAEAQEAALDSVDNTLARTLTMAGRSGGLEGWSAGLASIEAVMASLGPSSGGGRAGVDALASSLHGMNLEALAAIPTAEELQAAYDELGRTFDAVAATYTNTTDALDAGFRIIVGNTNAIADQAQGVADWATELIDVEGTYSKLDDLLANNAITLGEYKAAQQAHNSIIADNALIQEDVLSIQAQQAPVLAELTARQAEYIDSVANMDTEQQTLALAYMDSATAMQALELAQIAMSEAPGFEGLIEGAIAANPYIEAILTDMGIISRGTKGELVINTTGETEVESLTNAINALNTTFTTLLKVEVDRSAIDDLLTGAAAAGFPMGGDAGGTGTGGSLAFNVVMTADNSDVVAKIDDSTGKLAAWEASSGTGDVLADNTDAISKVGLAAGRLADWDASTGTANLNAADNASGVIASVNNALNALNGKTATTYVNTVYTTAGAALGGVMGYANGGITALMGEWGTETLHFPNGGVAQTRGRGMYTVPQGTYVSPHNGTERSGGMNLNITVNGDIYDTEDLAVAISRHTVPAIQRAVAQHVRGF